jgi:hypothetical protein
MAVHAYRMLTHNAVHGRRRPSAAPVDPIAVEATRSADRLVALLQPIDPHGAK